MATINATTSSGSDFVWYNPVTWFECLFDLIKSIFESSNKEVAPLNSNRVSATPPSVPAQSTRNAVGQRQKVKGESPQVKKESPLAKRVREGLLLMTQRLNDGYYKRGNFQSGWKRITWLCGKIEKLSDTRAKTTYETRLIEIITRLNNVEGLDTLQQAPTIMTNIRGRVDKFYKREEFTAAYDELGDLLERLQSCTKLNGYGQIWRQALDLRASLETKYKEEFSGGGSIPSRRKPPVDVTPTPTEPSSAPVAPAVTSKASELAAIIHRAALNPSAPRPTMAQLKEHARLREAQAQARG